MGRTGICWDNALAESFFAALKNELVHRLALPTRGSACLADEDPSIEERAGSDDERARAAKWGVTDLDKQYDLNELARGDCIFAATGVTDGSLLVGRHSVRNCSCTARRQFCTE